MQDFTAQHQEISSDASIVHNFYTKVYGWMTLAMIVTAIVAFMTASNEAMITAILSSRGLFFGLIIGELALVMLITSRIDKLTPIAAQALFIAYAAVNGLTLSVILIAYTGASIASTFVVTGGVFGFMATYGAVTKQDLSTWGNLFFMGVIGIIIASVVNFFLKSTAIYWIITYAGVLVFAGLTAYDMQKLKHLAHRSASSQEATAKSAIIGALMLYLDFINLFLFLLRILGRRR